MNFLQQKLSGVSRRLNAIPYGMFYLRNSDYKIPEQLMINGKKTNLHLSEVNIHEFTGICINDCYHLKYLKNKLKNISCIIDVGANHGMFLVAARQNFPKAEITAYEPNENLKSILEYNAEQLNAKVFFEAVMKEDCMVDLNFTGSDLATTATQSTSGLVPGTSLQTVLERSGNIDILKLDCEGAEWGLLEKKEPWKQVRALAMEYHLWGKPGSKKEDLYQLLEEVNFEIIRQVEYNSQQGFILALNREHKNAIE